MQAKDKKRNKLVAIKIIRSVQKYRDASRIELRVLATLKANDHENRNRCIHLRDCFDYRGHICIVMDLLGQSVFDFLKGNQFVPFPNSQIQSFARQLFTSVACECTPSQHLVASSWLSKFYTISTWFILIWSRRTSFCATMPIKPSLTAAGYHPRPPLSIAKLLNVKCYLTPRFD